MFNNIGIQSLSSLLDVLQVVYGKGNGDFACIPTTISDPREEGSGSNSDELLSTIYRKFAN